MMDSKKAG
ncbi:hypothetical protein LINGRAHAP2_LOCUS15584 [Linum grandiflorum]